VFGGNIIKRKSNTNEVNILSSAACTFIFSLCDCLKFSLFPQQTYIIASTFFLFQPYQKGHAVAMFTLLYLVVELKSMRNHAGNFQYSYLFISDMMNFQILCRELQIVEYDRRLSIWYGALESI
jgi:hypothetical protein